MRLQTQDDVTAALMADVKRLDREADAINEAMEKSGRKLQAQLDEARKVAEKARGVAEKLKDDYARVLVEAEADERKRLTEINPTEEDLKGCKVTAEVFIKEHLSEAEVALRAKTAAQEHVAGILPAVRSAALELLTADVAVANLEAEIAFCNSAPLSARLEAQKARLKETDQHASIGLTALALAMSKRDGLRHRREIAGGCSGRGGILLFNLDAAALEDLKFDPIITDSALPNLESLLAKVRAAGPRAKVATLAIEFDGKFGVVRIDK